MNINERLVRQLIASQFPQWGDLPVTGIEPGGWDNRSFRLGDELLVRLPSAAHYVPQVEKEQRWLPHIAPHLPFTVPEPVAMGAPGAHYPWPWSVYRWLSGDIANANRVTDMTRFATDLGRFLTALQAIDASAGPAAGAHSFHRGGELAVYDGETRRSLAALSGTIDMQWATRVWQTALSSRWRDTPVWVHGDIAAGNLLVDHGRLSGVIDFGCLAVGDPACDLVIAWTFLHDEGRAAFKRALPHLDRNCWDRARGWALWKALITRADPAGASPPAIDVAERTLAALMRDGQ